MALKNKKFEKKSYFFIKILKLNKIYILDQKQLTQYI